MDVEFVASREEMLKYAGMSVQGMALPDRNIMFSLLKDEGSPIKHEMMHMISMYKWGYPVASSTWMNEGLATYSDGSCLAYSFTEIYKYFMQSNKLIPMQALTSDFYGNPDIIAYTQSAFICKYLIENFGIAKFTQLWKSGIDKFPEIYGFDLEQLESDLANFVTKKHPTDIVFDWEEFNKGC